jgi:hypothetical protein
MAVDVGDAGHAQGMPLVALPRRRADLERGNDAGLERHPHVATPTLRRQGFVEMKRRGCWVHLRYLTANPLLQGDGFRTTPVLDFDLVMSIHEKM